MCIIVSLCDHQSIQNDKNHYPCISSSHSSFVGRKNNYSSSIIGSPNYIAETPPLLSPHFYIYSYAYWLQWSITSAFHQTVMEIGLAAEIVSDTNDISSQNHFHNCDTIRSTGFECTYDPLLIVSEIIYL